MKYIIYTPVSDIKKTQERTGKEAWPLYHARLYQLSYQAIWELVIMCVCVFMITRRRWK